MQKLFSFFIALFIGCNTIAQVNLDSLWNVWNDENQPDTNRLKAMKTIAWKGYLFSQPDSAFHFAGLQYDFAESVNNKKWIAQALIIQGLSFYFRSDYAKAMEYYTRSLKINEEIGDTKGIASALNNIAEIYRIQGDYAKAIDYYTKNLKIFEEIGNNKGVAASLMNVGTIYNIQGNLAKAIDYHTKSLKIKEETGDKKGIASSLINIGIIYWNQGDLAKALDYYTRSLKINEEIGDKQGIANSLNNIGTMYLEQRDFPKAIEYYARTLKIDEELGNKRDIASSLNSIGNLYKDQGDYGKAIENFTRSLKIFKEIEFNEGIANTLIGIGVIYYKQGHYHKALEKCKKSLNIAQEIGNVRQIRYTSNNLWQINKKLGKHRQALEMYELYIQMNDSILSIENKEAIIHQEFKYKYEKQAAADSVVAAEANKVKNAQLATLKAENKQHQLEADQQQLLANQQDQQKYFLYGLLALALIFGGFIFNRFRITNKQKKLIETQHEKLNESHKEITDSINYAKRIQDALMTSSVYMKDVLPESFIFFQPKDVVSGDFYWVYRSEKGEIFFTVADCTGHGVPGAFMSMIGNSLLNEMIIENNIQDTDLILDQVSDKVKMSLEQKGQENQSKDGMDMVLCRLNEKKNELMFTGAKNSLVLIREGEVFEYKGDKRPVGFYLGKGIKFTAQNIKIKKNDMLYIYSDGFVDQFGGEKGKKYMAGKFKKFLLSISNQSAEDQQKSMEKEFANWLGTIEQIDDVCVMGVRV